MFMFGVCMCSLCECECVCVCANVEVKDLYITSDWMIKEKRHHHQSEVNSMSFLFPVYIPFHDKLDLAYTVERQIGKGAHGTTFLVQSKTDVPITYLLKRVDFDFDANDSSSTQSSSFIEFVFEIYAHQFAYEISANEIPKLREWWVYEGSGYIVMEYINGGSMQQCLGGITSAAQYMQIIKRWRFFASHGVFHGDLKTSNILCKQNSESITTSISGSVIGSGSGSGSSSDSSSGSVQFMLGDWGVAVLFHKFTLDELQIILREKYREEKVRLEYKMRDQTSEKRRVYVQVLKIMSYVNDMCESGDCRDFIQELLYYEMAFRLNLCVTNRKTADRILKQLHNSIAQKYNWEITDSVFFVAFHRYVDWLRNVLWMYQMEKAERQYIEQFISQEYGNLHSEDDVKNHSMYRYLNPSRMLRAYRKVVHELSQQQNQQQQQQHH